MESLFTINYCHLLFLRSSQSVVISIYNTDWLTALESSSGAAPTLSPRTRSAQMHVPTQGPCVQSSVPEPSTAAERLITGIDCSLISSPQVCLQHFTLFPDFNIIPFIFYYLLGWPWLIRSCRFQVHISTIHVCILHCVLTTQNLLSSHIWPPWPFTTFPTSLPSGNHNRVVCAWVPVLYSTWVQSYGS